MFAANRFNLSIKHLRENLLLPQEFVLLAKSNVLEYEALVLPPVHEHSPEKFALSLGRAELESCLLELLTETTLRREQELLRIMAIRMSPWLTKLIWAFAQFDYKLPVLREAATLAAASPNCAEELLKIISGKDKDKDLIFTIVETLLQEGGELCKFISKYNIIAGSSMAKAVIRQFFQQTGETDFLVNEEYFLDMVGTESEEDLRPCLINYLERSWRHFSSRKINRALLKRFGLPEEDSSIIWQNIDPSLITKYKRWIFTDIMEEHFGLKSRKYILFGKFCEAIRRIKLFKDGHILVLDFGHFGIVNIRNMKENSYLMEKNKLETEMENLEAEDEPSWLKNRLPIEARDVIIEEKSSDILILNIAGVGKLFAQELMEELLRKEEGLWPVRYKHAIARFREKYLDSVLTML